MAFYYDADDYFYGFNREYYPEHEIDAEPDPDYYLTLEEREKRWHERRWMNEPEVIADDWLFKPLPYAEFDEF